MTRPGPAITGHTDRSSKDDRPRLIRSSAMTLFASLLICFAVGGRAAALDAARGMRQFQHTAWTPKDGAPPDIWALAQTTDGYLWLGTGAGLYRFDGVHFERYRPPLGPELRSPNILALKALPSGELWIGYKTGGVSRLKDGVLTNFDRPTGSLVEFAQDRDGAVWAGSTDGLMRFSGGIWRAAACAWDGANANVRSLIATRDGAILATTDTSVFYLSPESMRCRKADIQVAGLPKLAQAPDGRLWLSDQLGGIRPIPDLTRPAVHAPASPKPKTATPPLIAVQMIFDADGALWGSNGVDGGLFRFGRPSVLRARAPVTSKAPFDRFGLADGLSSDIAHPVLEDREGDIWVGTNLGLDRFRHANIVTEAGVPLTSFAGYQGAVNDRGVYVASGDTLYALSHDAEAKPVGRLPSRVINIVPAGDRLWLGAMGGLMRWAHGALAMVPLAARSPRPVRSDERISNAKVWAAPHGPNIIRALERDSRGTLWVAPWNESIRLEAAGRWSTFPTPSNAKHSSPQFIKDDPAHGTWLSYFGGPLVLADAQGVKRSWDMADVGIGEIQVIQPDARGTLLGGDGGVARFDGRTFHRLLADRLAPLARISGVTTDAKGDIWIFGIMGVVRLSPNELDRAMREPSYTPRFDLFDFRDGLPGVAEQDAYTPTVLRDPGGWLWFLTNHGVAWTDPSNLRKNPWPPPVSITDIQGGGKRFRWPRSGTVMLPAGLSDLEIDYTALSLSIPERVRFRYRLDGVDRGWIDPGLRRQAFYTKLGPGKYRFQVIASNNDGVWNRTGAKVTLVIPPTFFQSAWFFALCALAAGVVIWGLYRIRLRQVAGRIRARLEERVAERERIARELHDTLLQSVQGLTMRFQSVADHIDDAHPAKAVINIALDRADQVLVEGRDRVRDLRRPDPRPLGAVLRELALEQPFAPTTKVEVVADGPPRDVEPMAMEEITRIGGEALFNAALHAHARHVQVRISYGAHRLQVSFCDDGVGVDETRREGARREGHYGLVGMQERAKKMGAHMIVESGAGEGTKIILNIAGQVAYGQDTWLRRMFHRTR